MKNGDKLVLVTPDTMKLGSPEYHAAMDRYSKFDDQAKAIFEKTGKLIEIDIVRESDKSYVKPRSNENSVQYVSL
jgi:hypothetical protein